MKYTALEWSDSSYLGNIVKYRFENNQIIASVSSHISINVTSGMVELYYELEDLEFIIKDVQFAPSEYKNL